MTYQAKPHILIVDDDDAIGKTLSAILQAEGCQTTAVTTAKEAIEKSKTQFFNLALLDIKLPDMEGTQLLAQLQEIVPDTIKIMVTGYPSLKNAVEALNFGADSYIMKPIDPAELLKKIKSKLEAQKQTEKITKEKLAKWIQLQARNAQSSNFQEFLEETANVLADFGLTKTQAKIYIALVASGVASASQIAEHSKIRREEVYRVIPELEKRGLLTKKLKTPRKFSAIQPETAIEILTKSKLKAMQEEVEKLGQTSTELISKLKTIELPTEQDDPSIEVLSHHDIILAKLIDMAKNAKEKMDIVATLQALKFTYINHPRGLVERVLKSVRMRIVATKCELDAFTKEIMQFSETNNNPIKLRQIEKLPFNLLIADDKEAIWGENTIDEDKPMFWTNDPTQVAILKTSFESLWQHSTSIEKILKP
jgi:DNA-binding response OmpR family regulator